jgi:hypothetical protein
MNIEIGTPALLFSATSLILLAYTNRFLTIATIVRGLKDNYDDSESENLLRQIHGLRKRIILIRNMQQFGVLSLFFSVFSMMLLFLEQPKYGTILFGVSLLLLLISLGISLWEISISMNALHLHLSGLEKKSGR